MIGELLFGLGVIVGMLLTAWLLGALWIGDRQRSDARITELLTLIEAQRAPAEYAGYVAQAPAEPGPQYLFSDDGLIGIPLPEDT